MRVELDSIGFNTSVLADIYSCIDCRGLCTDFSPRQSILTSSTLTLLAQLKQLLSPWPLVLPFTLHASQASGYWIQSAAYLGSRAQCRRSRNRLVTCSKHSHSRVTSPLQIFLHDPIADSSSHCESRALYGIYMVLINSTPPAFSE